MKIDTIPTNSKVSQQAATRADSAAGTGIDPELLLLLNGDSSTPSSPAGKDSTPFAQILASLARPNGATQNQSAESDPSKEAKNLPKQGGHQAQDPISESIYALLGMLTGQNPAKIETPTSPASSVGCPAVKDQKAVAPLSQLSPEEQLKQKLANAVEKSIPSNEQATQPNGKLPVSADLKIPAVNQAVDSAAATIPVPNANTTALQSTVVQTDVATKPEGSASADSPLQQGKTSKPDQTLPANDQSPKIAGLTETTKDDLQTATSLTSMAETGQIPKSNLFDAHDLKAKDESRSSISPQGLLRPGAGSQTAPHEALPAQPVSAILNSEFHTAPSFLKWAADGLSADGTMPGAGTQQTEGSRSSVDSASSKERSSIHLSGQTDGIIDPQQTQSVDIQQAGDTVPAHVLAHHLEQLVVEHLDQARPTEPASVVLRLDPPELGQVNVHLSVTHDDFVSIRMVASDEAARQIIERQLNDLQQSLADQGVSLNQCQVECNTGGQSFDRRMPLPNEHDREAIPFASQRRSMLTSSPAPRSTRTRVDYVA